MLRTHFVTQSITAKKSILAAIHELLVKIALAFASRKFVSFAKYISFFVSEGVTK